MHELLDNALTDAEKKRIRQLVAIGKDGGGTVVTPQQSIPGVHLLCDGYRVVVKREDFSIYGVLVEHKNPRKLTWVPATIVD